MSEERPVTPETTVEENTITTDVLEDARVREIDFVERFSDSIKKLVEALGVTRKIARVAGTVLKTYKATGTLESGDVPEGEIIPLSLYTVEPTSYKEINFQKWRKQTTLEGVADKTYDQAVAMTTERMLKDVQKGIRKAFFDFLAGATAEEKKLSGKGLQGALAAAWGSLQVLFEDDDVQTVFFVNPNDIADYLADASITTQNAFGMKYVKDFMGLGTVISNASVPAKTVYATAADNIVLYYVGVNGADINKAFTFVSDETGYIGIHEEPDYKNMTISDTVIAGIELFAERTDGIVTVNITNK